MQQLKRYFALALYILLLALPVLAGADFGDYSGDSDYGGSWSSSSSSSYSSSYDDYGSSYYDDSDEVTFFDVSLAFGIVMILAAYATIGDWHKSRSEKNNKNAARAEGAKRTDASKLSPLSKLKAADPAFDEGALAEKLSNLYMQMQSCWTAKDIEPLRPYFTDAFFTQLERQLNGHKRRGVTNYVERIAVLGVELRGFFTSGGEQHLIAELRTRIVDYTLEDKSGELVSGNKNKEKFMTYEWELTRAEGSKTEASAGVKSITCPGCGAPMSINTTARCEYCGRVVTLNHADWAISAIRGISQRTV